MLEFLVFSDLHAHNYSACSTMVDGMNSRLKVCVDVLCQIRSYAKEHKIPLTLFLGDLFQSTAKLDVEVLNVVHQALTDWPGELISLVGNHDWVSEARDIHALEVFKRNFQVIDRPTSLTRQGSLFFLAPYRKSGWKEELRGVRADYYCLHQGIEGVEIRPGLYLKERMDLEDMPADGLVFSGHYHNFQRPVSNIFYTGAPLHRDWADQGTHKCFLHVRGGKIKRIGTRAPRFVQLELRDIEAMQDQSCCIDGNYVRLILQKPADQERLLEMAYSFGALWVGMEGRSPFYEGVGRGMNSQVAVGELLRHRVIGAPAILKKSLLLDLGSRLVNYLQLK